MEKLEIAGHILKHCFWGNTALTPQDIIKNIDKKDFARNMFSAIFQNSPDMLKDLSLIKREFVMEFIISQNQRLGYFKRDYLEPRIDFLIKHYEIKDAGKRREIYTVVSNAR